MRNAIAGRSGCCSRLLGLSENISTVAPCHDDFVYVIVTGLAGTVVGAATTRLMGSTI
jgi:hypothetical protein